MRIFGFRPVAAGQEASLQGALPSHARPAPDRPSEATPAGTRAPAPIGTAPTNSNDTTVAPSPNSAPPAETSTIRPRVGTLTAAPRARERLGLHRRPTLVDGKPRMLAEPRLFGARTRAREVRESTTPDNPVSWMIPPGN